MGEHKACVQRWLGFLTALDYTIEYRSGSSCLIPVDDGGIFLIRACGIRTRSCPTPCVGLEGLVPRAENTVLDGLPSASSDFRDSRARATYED